MFNASFLPIVFLALLLCALILKLVKGPVVPRSDGAKSTLARDGSEGGIGFLIPKAERAAVAALRAGNRKP